MKKVLKVTAVTALLSLGLVFASYAGQWKQGAGANTGKWWYDEENGTYATNGWRWIDGNGDGIAENYCFDQNGWLYVSTETPDKKTVDANGARTQDGKVVTMDVNSGDTTYTVDGTGTLEPKTYKGIDFSLENLGHTSMAIGSIMYPKSNTVTAEKILNYKSFYDSGTDNSWMNAEQKAAVESFVSNWVKDHIRQSMTEDEKAKTIYDWMQKNITYDLTAPNDQSSYGVFIEKRGVCGGYTNGFMALAKACGLEVKSVFTLNHAFNVVKLDGMWYTVDATQGAYKNRDIDTVYYCAVIPEGDKSDEEKAKERRERESERTEKIAKENVKSQEKIEEARKNNAIFQLDDENLVSKLLDYIYSQADGDEEWNQHVGMIICTGNKKHTDFSKMKFTYNGFTGRLDDVIDHEIHGKTANGFYIGTASSSRFYAQQNQGTDGVSIFLTSWEDENGKKYEFLYTTLLHRDERVR